MNRTANSIVLAAVAGLAAFAAPANAAGIRPAAEPIPGQFIVVLRDSAVRPGNADRLDARPSVAELAGSLADEHRGRSGRRFGTALQGFVFRGKRADAAALAGDPRVAYVAEDGWVSVAGQVAPPSWGLDRIDQRDGALDSYYEYYADGAVVDVYVVDTGIRSTHVDFEGRVDLGASFSAVDDGNGTEDCNGHGTHVAGIIGGATYGVAKGVTLHPVRVLDCYGRGAESQIVAGIDWITARYATTTTTDGGGRKGGGKTSGTGSTTTATGARPVVNLSLSTKWASVLDDAVARSIAAGIVYVVAAGNGSENACYVSPSAVPGAIVVGATAADDSVVPGSNFGPCVDLHAPGSGIVSSFVRSDSDAVAMTGTSMAAPHVAGTAALLLSINPALTPAEVQSLLIAAASAGGVANPPANTSDRLLYAPFTGHGVDMEPIADFSATCSRGSCKFDGRPALDDRGLIGFAWTFAGKTASGELASGKVNSSAGSEMVVSLTVTDTTGQTATISKLVRTGF